MQKKLLMLTEASFLNTGFASISRNLLGRLKEKGLEVAELSCFIDQSDQRQNQMGWKCYPAIPHPSDKKRLNEYNSNPHNCFGSYLFNDIVLDYKPTHVLSYLDYWCCSYVNTSPFRNLFKWIWVPAVDSAPVRADWLADLHKCDHIFSYTDWGLKVLKEAGLSNLRGVAAPGVDHSQYKPIWQKKELRVQYGVDPDSFIIGNINRNQKRKLFPDLILFFRKFLEIAPPDIAKKSYLYIHTSFPDQGFDLPTLIKESGIGHRLLVTYYCRNCKSSYPSFWNDVRTICKRCNQPTSSFTNTQYYVDDATINVFLNLMDCYLQYSVAEGLAIGQVQAAACGIPIFTMDYSGMEDVWKKCSGTPLEINQFYREAETHCWRAYPNIDDTLEKLLKFAKLPIQMRQKKGFQASLGAQKHYDYDKLATQLFSFIQNDNIDDLKKWESRLPIYSVKQQELPKLPPSDFVKWAVINVAGLPHLLDTFYISRMIRDLNYGMAYDNLGGITYNDDSFLGLQRRPREYGPNEVINELKQLREVWNMAEQKRVTTQI